MKTFSSFHEYLLWRAARSAQRGWFKRSPVDDLVLEFHADVTDRPPECVRPAIPNDDAELYAYLDRFVGDVELLSDQTKALDYLVWGDYLRVSPLGTARCFSRWTNCFRQPYKN